MAQAQDSPNAPLPAPSRQGGELVPPAAIPDPAAESPGWSLGSALMLVILVAALILAFLRFRGRGRQ